MVLLRNTLARRFRQLLHTLGFSCIGGAVFLQILVFGDIATQGYFLAVEQNKLVLALEVALTTFALVYFSYVYWNFIHTLE